MLPLLERLGWWGIDFHLPSGVLLLAVMLCSIGVRQPARRRAIGGAAAVGLLLLALLTVLPGWPRMAWRQAPPRHALPQIVQRPSAGAASEPLTVNRSAMPDWSNHELAAAPGQAPPATDVPPPALAVPPSARPQPSAVTPTAANPVNWPALAGAFILVGAAWAGIWLLLGTVQAARIRRGAQAAGPELSRVFDRVVGAPRHKPQLLVSGDTTLPLAMGLFRPAIVLPQSCASTSPGVEVEAAIAHEWAHVRHGDLWLLALLRLLLPLFACQPLFWWLRKTIRTAQEELADAAASDRGGRVAYAEVLLAWARISPAVLPPGLDGSLALWERPSQLKRRVLTLLDRRFHVELCCSRRRRVAITSLMLVMAAILSVPSLRPAASAVNAGGAAPDDTVTITGRVSADGVAVAGATIYLRESPVSWSTSQGAWRPSPTRNIALTKADESGRFEFAKLTLPETTPLRQTIFPLDVVVTARGRGVAWQHIVAPPTLPLELELPDESSISGRLIERDGRPVAGARVRVRELAELAEPWRPSPETPGYVDLESSIVPLTDITDATGRFVVGGLPPEIRATLVIDDHRYLGSETCFATTDIPQLDLIELPGSRGGEPRIIPVHVGEAEITVERSYHVLGRVLFSDTGKPAEGAGWNNPPLVSSGGATDAEGRFALHSLTPGEVRLRVTPPPGSNYLGVASTLELSGDNYEIEHTIELPRGEVIRGRVVDLESRKGIGGATIWYNGQKSAAQNDQAFVVEVQSTADGSFTMAVLPGKAELIVAGLVPGYKTHNRSGPATAAPAEFHQPIDVRTGEPHPAVTFELRPNPNAALAGTAIDLDGKPVEDVEIVYQGFGEKAGAQTSYPVVRTTSDGEGRFVLKNLEPSFEYDVRLIDRHRGLGSYVLLSQLDQPKTPLAIELQPLAVAAGRVVDEGGRPVVGAAVRLFARQGQTSRVDGEPTATDSDGWFEFPRMLPGATYSLSASADGYATKHGVDFTPAADENQTLPDVILPRADQEVVGLLVDAQGAPVDGARVYARATFVDANFRARTKTVLTDQAGRFRLSGLPRGEAEVWHSFDQFDNRRTLLGKVSAGAKGLRFVVASAGANRSDEASKKPPEPSDNKPGSGPRRPPTTVSKDRRADGPATAQPKKPLPQVNIAVTRGRVLTPEGKPLSGAKLFLSYPNVAKVQPQLLGESGADGRFEFRVDKSQLDTSYTPDPWSAAAITAVAEGFGFEWVETSKTDADGNLTIKLLEDVPIHGRILTLEGRPVVGAKVKLNLVTAPHGGLDDYIKELRGGLRGDGALQSSRLGRSSFPGMRDTAVTDAAGRFTLSGIGAERIVQMLVTSDEVEHVFLRALTRDIDPIEPPQVGPGIGAPGKVFGTNFEFLARPSRKIVGTVRERGGQPLPGISLRSFSGAGLTATTDAQGRYELIGHPKAQQYQVRVMPENMPYFGTMLNIADTPGLDPIVADIELSRGIAVQGHVTAGPNREPNEATVEYYPLFGNKYVGRIGQLPAANQAAASATCDAEGRYSIPVLPGPGVLTFNYGPWYRQAVARDYLPAWLDREKVDELYRALGIEQPQMNNGNSLRTETGSNMMASVDLGRYNQALLINPDENDDSLTQDVQLELGRTLAVTIETPDGKPPVGLSIRGRTNMQFVRETFDAPEFTVTGLHPKIDRELIVEAPAEKLAAYRLIHAGETDPIVLRLEPYGAVAGRLLDDDGEPLANTTLGIGKARTMPPEFSATTDNDGRFRLDGLVPGLPYGITVRRRPAQMGMGMIQLAMNVVVEPGKTTDLGDLDLKPKAMGAPAGFGRPPGRATSPGPNGPKPAKPTPPQEK